MLKVILSVFMAIFFTTCLLMIFYWRDTQLEPNELDLIIYLILLPLALSLIFLTPYWVWKWFKQRQEKQQINQAIAQSLQDQPVQDTARYPCEWFELNMYTTAVRCALGENEQIISSIQAFSGPELDSQLLDDRSNPILSYRIKALDALVEQGDQTFELNPVQQRLRILIEQQLQQYTDVLTVIADHLKHSTLFYDHPLAYEYRVHPAWFHPEAAIDDEEITLTEPVMRLEKINVHIILSEDFQHLWDESSTTSDIEQYLSALGILPQLMNCQYHYFSLSSHYANWLQCLTEVNKKVAEVSLFIVTDSEISQQLMTEKYWSAQQYTPAEFVASCLLANKSLQIENLEPTQKILVVTKANDLMQNLAHWKLLDLEQYKHNQPFVSILDDPMDTQVVRKLQQYFADSPIESEHFLYGKSCLGHCQNLSEIFCFMLAMHMQPSLQRMVFSIAQPMTQIFMSLSHIDEMSQHTDDKI
ncbi:hypothetical protein [Acinetobacter rudis]|uniref:Uncharacterized protein n=1 Tax=Acinetobacter rudis CIP 110305 TaxID=421052 RepID=S3P6I4_9GAMM|nr:hypothetical protein [Acinetobacter rudis]EPF74476.1 hypothetical protein F945_01515 [Acinetobacter rudis CIP 110305]